MPKTFSQSLHFDAPPSRVFALYADAGLHAGTTGSGAAIQAKAGTAFTAWDGYIGGVNLHVVPDRMIVQTWRASDWGKDESDSVLVLLFLPEDGGTRLLVTHANVPDDQAAELKAGWTEYYWKPWKKWLKDAARAEPGVKKAPAKAKAAPKAKPAAKTKTPPKAKPGKRS
jgi:uncharacterized protein YndB with AHSA1/START domain